MKANKVLRLVTGILSAVFAVVLSVSACILIEGYLGYSETLVFAGVIVLLIAIADCVLSILLSALCNRTTYSLPIANLSINGVLFILYIIGRSVLYSLLTLAFCAMLIVVICLTNSARKNQKSDAKETENVEPKINSADAIDNIKQLKEHPCHHELYENIDKYFQPNNMDEDTFNKLKIIMETPVTENDKFIIT